MFELGSELRVKPTVQTINNFPNGRGGGAYCKNMKHYIVVFVIALN